MLTHYHILNGNVISKHERIFNLFYITYYICPILKYYFLDCLSYSAEITSQRGAQASRELRYAADVGFFFIDRYMKRAARGGFGRSAFRGLVKGFGTSHTIYSNHDSFKALKMTNYTMEQASELKMKRSELDSTQECVPNDESNAMFASSPEEDYTGTEEFHMDEDSHTQEDSDPDAREGFDLSTEEDVDSDVRDSLDSTTDEDVDSGIGEEFGSNTDKNVRDLEELWKYADETILQGLSNVDEKRTEDALGKATTEVRRLGLYRRLMTEVMIVQLTPYSGWFLDASGLCELTGN